MFNFESKIHYLTEIHDNALVNLLPQVSTEDLNERDLESGYLSMHEYSSQVQLHLETHIHIGPVDGGRPPQCKSSVWYLIETRSLCMGELLVLHRLFEPGSLLPEEALPCGEICALEECVFQYALHSSKSLDHVCSVVVKVPEFTVMLLMSPPEWVLFEDLVLLEVLSHSPSLVVCQS